MIFMQAALRFAASHREITAALAGRTTKEIPIPQYMDAYNQII